MVNRKQYQLKFNFTTEQAWDSKRIKRKKQKQTDRQKITHKDLYVISPL